MATETNTPAHDTGNNQVTLGFALLGGLGMMLMILGASIGVIGRENADNHLVGLLIFSGFLMLAIGIGAWLATARPWEHFDDINQPLYHGHHHDEHHGSDVDVELLTLDSGTAEKALPEKTEATQ